MRLLSKHTSHVKCTTIFCSFSSTNTMLDKIEKLIREYTHNTSSETETAGWYVFCVHMLIVAIVTYLLLWSNSLTLLSLGIISWLCIVAQHMIFDGCWMVRLERRLWETKEWYGPWTPVFKTLHFLGMSNNKRTHNLIFVIFALSLTSFAFLRLREMTKT